MSQIANNTFKLKRGQQAAVERTNPLLQAGEPIAVFCTDGKTRLKIGDGYTLYNDLDWVAGDSQREVLTYPTFADIPKPPPTEYIDCIFKVTDTSKLYQYNPVKLIFERLDEDDVDVTVDNIEVINGGTAADLRALK